METTVKTDRRILRSKQSIIKSFLELFSEKDFEQITINEIAERANVNRGTIYLHYSDKYDLLDKCMEDHINELISLCTKREALKDNQGMVQDPRPIFDYFRDHFPFFSAMFSNQRVFLFREQLLNFISVNLMVNDYSSLWRAKTQNDRSQHVNAGERSFCHFIRIRIFLIFLLHCFE